MRITGKSDLPGGAGDVVVVVANLVRKVILPLAYAARIWAHFRSGSCAWIGVGNTSTPCFISVGHAIDLPSSHHTDTVTRADWMANGAGFKLNIVRGLCARVPTVMRELRLVDMQKLDIARRQTYRASPFTPGKLAVCTSGVGRLLSLSSCGKRLRRRFQYSGAQRGQPRTVI